MSNNYASFFNRIAFLVIPSNIELPWPDEDGKKVDAKNKDVDEKIWKNRFDF